MTTTSQQFDVLIVGGGMVGATLACALGDTGMTVAVIESHEANFPWPPADYDNRVSAITRATQNVFSHIGAWAGMCERRVAPYYAMDVWDATGNGRIHFHADDIHQPDLGHIIENRVILAALHERMKQIDNVELFAPVNATDLEVTRDGVSLALNNQTLLNAKVIVGADGAFSWVREQMNIPVMGWSYQQHAVTANVTTSQPHNGTAYQRFMPTGPLAFLPMPEPHLASIVWSTTPEQAEALMSLGDEALLSELQEAFGDKLGRMEAIGPRCVTPLMLQHAEQYCAERCVLVGNAAHAIHPLAGQGLNLGVSDVAALVEVWLQAVTNGQDIGSRKVLRRYERWRKADNLSVMFAMDGFKRLFGNELPVVSTLRNVGMGVVDRMGPVKGKLMQRAMGLEGDLPKMTRSSQH